jgi:hypothetical protein
MSSASMKRRCRICFPSELAGKHFPEQRFSKALGPSAGVTSFPFSRNLNETTVYSNKQSSNNFTGLLKALTLIQAAITEPTLAMTRKLDSVIKYPVTRVQPGGWEISCNSLLLERLIAHCSISQRCLACQIEVEQQPASQSW